MYQIVAISEQAAEADGLAPALDDKSGHPMGWKSFDMRAVVAATEDLFQFILSDKGSRVRVFLVRDLLQAYDVFLQDEVFGCLCGNPQAKEQAPAQVCLFSLSHQVFFALILLWDYICILGRVLNMKYRASQRF